MNILSEVAEAMQSVLSNKSLQKAAKTVQKHAIHLAIAFASGCFERLCEALKRAKENQYNKKKKRDKNRLFFHDRGNQWH